MMKERQTVQAKETERLTVPSANQELIKIRPTPGSAGVSPASSRLRCQLVGETPALPGLTSIHPCKTSAFTPYLMATMLLLATLSIAVGATNTSKLPSDTPPEFHPVTNSFDY